MIKQVIVMRKDLGMRKGKMVAQGAHASMKVFFDRIHSQRKEAGVIDLEFSVNEDMLYWIEGKFAKICVSVNSEEELLSVYEQAKEAKLPVALITDAGATEFNGVPTNTCLAIGPAKNEEIDKITGNLKLL